MSWFALTMLRSARPPKFVSKPQIRWFVASIESSWAVGSWSSTELQWMTTRSPGFQLRTAAPTSTTTPDPSEPTTWQGRSWRAAGGSPSPTPARGPHAGTPPPPPPGPVGAEDVVGQGVAGAVLALLAEPGEEAERGHRLEDRGPDRVEVDRARHHGDVDLVGRQLRRGHLLDVDALAGVLVRGVDALEHPRLVLVDGGGPVGLRHGQRSDVSAAGAALDGIEAGLPGGRN